MNHSSRNRKKSGVKAPQYRCGDIVEHDAIGVHLAYEAKPCGDLIKQRLEQMIVVAIDQNDFERSPSEGFGRGKSTKPRTDDDDAGGGSVCSVRSIIDPS